MLEGRPTISTKLKPTQERFCWLYICCPASFGNATESYWTAFNFGDRFEAFKEAETKKYVTDKKVDLETIFKEKYRKMRNHAGVEGHRLLLNPKTQERIGEMLTEMFNDEVIDRELSRVVLQNEDLKSKVAAIREYNNLKKRVGKTPIVDKDSIEELTRFFKEMAKG